MIENRFFEGTDRLKAALRIGMTSLQFCLPRQEVWAGGAIKQ